MAEAGPAQTVTLGEVVNLSAAGSSDSDGTVASYAWDFGDGSTDTGSGETVAHTYATAGSYIVTLRITDDRGAVDEDATLVVVRSPPVADNQAPRAEAGASQTVEAGATVSFDASGSADPDGTIASWLWDFGDGSTGTGSAVTHSYPTPGTYAVTVVVTDDDGATSVDATVVVVKAPEVPGNAPPVAEAGPSRTADAGSAVSFDASGSSDPDGTIASYVWDFGDGSTGTGATPSHSYAEPGAYAVTVVVTDDDGAVAQDVTMVTVVAVEEPSGCTTAPGSAHAILGVLAVLLFFRRRRH